MYHLKRRVPCYDLDYHAFAVILSHISTDLSHKQRRHSSFTAKCALVMSQCGTVMYMYM